MSKQSLKALTVMLRATQSVEDVLRKDMQKRNMNMTEFAVLELLFHKGEQPIQKIGDKILITSGSITYVVDKLEKKGFVQRNACPTDRRVTFAQITKSGEEFMEQIFPQHEAKVAQLFEGITEEEVVTVIDLMKKVGFHAKELSE